MEEIEGTDEDSLTDYERGYRDGVYDALIDARYHIVGHFSTAEKWRYDRVIRDFGILLGEIDQSVLESTPDFDNN